MRNDGLATGNESERRSRVLIVDDDEDVRDLWVDILSDAGYSVVGVGDAQDALERAARIRPDVILLDMIMPGTDGAGFLEQLRRHPTGRAVPVLILSALEAGIAMAIRGRERELGIAGILGKPLTPDALVAEVRRVLAANRRRSVLLVEDEAGARRLQKTLLEEEGCEVDEVVDGREALARLAERTYDAVVLDLRLPYVDGHEVAKRIRQSESNHRTPVLMVTGAGDTKAREMGFEDQVVFFLHKPFTADAFRAAIRDVLD